MTQIQNNAIRDSQIENTQYVISNGSKQICIADKRELLAFLRYAWDIVKKYNNGIGEDNFNISEPSEVKCIQDFIEQELLEFNIASCATNILVSFQEFYEPESLEIEELRSNVSLLKISAEGPLNWECFYFTNENAEKLRNEILRLNIKQDKKSLVTILEKEFEEE